MISTAVMSNNSRRNTRQQSRQSASTSRPTPSLPSPRIDYESSSDSIEEIPITPPRSPGPQPESSYYLLPDGEDEDYDKKSKNRFIMLLNGLQHVGQPNVGQVFGRGEQEMVNPIQYFGNVTYPQISEDIDSLRFKFSQLQRCGYSQDISVVIPDHRHPYWSHICIICFDFVCNPVHCLRCDLDFCRGCLDGRIRPEDNTCRNMYEASTSDPDQGAMRHNFATSYPDDRLENLDKHLIKCEYGCVDHSGNPRIFESYTEGHNHNYGRNDCPNRKCQKCKMYRFKCIWKTEKRRNDGGEEYNVFIMIADDCSDHFGDFAEFLLSHSTTRVESHSKALENQLADSRANLTAAESYIDQLTVDLAKANSKNSDFDVKLATANSKNEELKEEISDWRRKYYEKDHDNDQLGQINQSLQIENRRIKQQLEAFRSQRIPEPIPFLEGSHEASPYTSGQSSSQTPLPLVAVPTDCIPKVTGKFVQVHHPTLGIREMPVFPSNASWGQLGTMATRLFGVSVHDFDLVSLRVRVEKPKEDAFQGLHSTHVLNLVPKGQISPGTAYKFDVTNSVPLFNPNTLAAQKNLLLAPLSTAGFPAAQSVFAPATFTNQRTLGSSSFSSSSQQMATLPMAFPRQMAPPYQRRRSQNRPHQKHHHVVPEEHPYRRN